MDTRTTLLSHAEHLARQGGYDGFSFANLATRSGIRKASVHHHFATKPALAAELMETYSARVRTRLEAVDEADAATRLAEVLDLYREALDNGHSQCLCVAFSAIRDRLPEDIQLAVSQFQSQMRDWLERIFADGAQDGSMTAVQLTPATDAAAAFALLEGAQLIARAGRDVTQFDLATAPLRARIITGGKP